MPATSTPGRSPDRRSPSLGAGASAIRRAVVVGPAHYVPVRGIAVPSAAAFCTPLGEVPLDQDAIDALRDLPQMKLADVPHEPEHALEVELPFLQAVLGDFALVPLLVGEATRRRGRRSAGAPVGRARDPDRDQLRSVPLRAVRARARSTTRRPRRRSSASTRRPSGRAMPAAGCRSAGCSWRRLAAAMRVARLDLRNSGDTAGPKDQVVGYGAWAFYET